MLRLMVGSFKGITRGEFLLGVVTVSELLVEELERFEEMLVEVLELSSSLLLLLVLLWKILSLKDPRHELPMKQY